MFTGDGRRLCGERLAWSALSDESHAPARRVTLRSPIDGTYLVPTLKVYRRNGLETVSAQN
jgi:hypothetical protein